MPKSEINALTLVAVLIALGLTGTIAGGLPVYSELIAGVILLVLIFAYDREGYRTMWQSFVFAGVAGACVSVIVSVVLQLGGAQVPHAFPWAPIVWIGATLILWAIDMSRMQKRFAAQAFPVAPQPVPVVAQAPAWQQEPIRVQPPAPPPPAPPAPVWQQPAPPPAAPRPTSITSLFSQAPIEREPEPAVAAPVPAPAAPIQQAPAAPAPAPAPAQQPVPMPRGSGKPVTIYLNLVGEGLAVMRSVQAEHVGKDYYMIVEPMPPGENWEFTTGQVVRCQKRNLSSGKGLVAVEEAPRAS